MEAKISYLQMIQAVIERMARNSFSLKEWTVLLISALIALDMAKTEWRLVYIAYFPGLSFWILDGYYLWQERLYRKLYDTARVLDEKEIDFGLGTSQFIATTPTWFATIFSKTLLVFYLSAMIVITIAIFALN
ncbi:MAG: hypothetical protein PHR28_08000 [candidate division Zixibacteria bacterium]|nr:hypothetical protein [candidate division Zixibacteria bacterium]